MKPLHGFLQDKKWYEDLGHIVLGLAPIGLLLWAREWTAWRMPWPLTGQYPPGEESMVDDYENQIRIRMVPLDRVSDVGRDELGYVVGATIRNVGLIVWWATC